MKIKLSKILCYTNVLMLIMSFIIILLVPLYAEGQLFGKIMTYVFCIISCGVVFIVTYKICFFDIIIDEEGISKYRYKRKFQTIYWDELKDVKFFNPICPWIAFSKKTIGNANIDKVRFSKKAIVFLYKEGVEQALEKYCTNEDILKMCKLGKYRETKN